MITRNELIKKYLEFFKSKKHKVVPSASLIPEGDPTTLFISAGMQPLIPYLLGQKHPLGKRIANMQKCIRTVDIDEVGDTPHHTFFEMLGNWSLGDYWKKEAIEWSFEFLTKELKIPAERIAVSVFLGDENAQKDIEAAKAWLSLGIPKSRIAYLGKKENWWGPAGVTGPCGPDTEMFYWKNNSKPAPKKFNSKDDNWVEIWNDVLMQYTKDKTGNYAEALQKNIDTGMGVERTVAVLNGLEDNYLSGMWKPIIEKIEKLSGKSYKGNEKAMRIIADHIKAPVFIISDGVVPSNTERGYVLRRLIRRAVRYGKNLGMQNFTKDVAESVFEIYERDYSELKRNKEKILNELEKEETRFLKTLEKGMKIFEKRNVRIKMKRPFRLHLNILNPSKKNKDLIKDENQDITESESYVSGKDAFLLYQSYGFPIEITIELAKERGMNVDTKEFEEELKKHQELSRTATKGKFRAGLADGSEQTTKYHTATHLLHKALKKVLGEEVRQMGSNITPERLRFDFNFPRKLTSEEIKKIENLVNSQIKRKLPVDFVEMPYTQAVKTGALSYFKERYPKVVKVYSVGDFSKEICTGPHVKNTSEMGKFRITKEESSSAGVRRIKAELLDETK